MLSVGSPVPLQSACPASAIHMVPHRHYFQKGFEHRLPAGVDMQSPWKTCTLSSFSDNHCLYGACWVRAVFSAAAPPVTAQAYPETVKLS